MLKLGMLDLDTSHVVEFVKRMNHLGVPDDQKVEGARIVAACPGESKIMPERIPGFVKTLKDELKVEIVEKPEALIGKIDGLLLEGNDGSSHLPRAKPFIEAGIPVWIDKPLTWSVKDAEELANLAAKKKVPIFSASSLRYATEVQALKAEIETIGAPVAVHTFGPQARKDNIPGWFFYGIHAVELLYALLGTGAGKIALTRGTKSETASAVWQNGAVGTATLLCDGEKPFGFDYFGTKGSKQVRIDGTYSYRELCKAIVTFMQSRRAPVDIAETIETIRFIEATNSAGGL